MIVTLNLTVPDHIEHYPLSEQNIMLWIKKKCKQSNCMHRLGIFPGSVMVEVMPKVQMPNECASIRKGVVAMLKLSNYHQFFECRTHWLYGVQHESQNSRCKS